MKSLEKILCEIKKPLKLDGKLIPAVTQAGCEIEHIHYKSN